MWAVVTIDIDLSLLRTMVDVNYVKVLVIEQWFVVSRAVVDLKSKFLLVCYWISTKNSIVVVANVVVVVAEAGAMDFDNSTMCRYCKQMIVASYLRHLC